MIPFITSHSEKAIKLYEDHSNTIARVAAVATPILMQCRLTAFPLGSVLTAVHCVRLLQADSPCYGLCALHVSSLALSFFFPPVASALFLLQSITVDLHHLYASEGSECFQDLANITSALLRLAILHKYSPTLAIASSVLRFGSDLHKFIQEANTHRKGKERYIELVGSLVMLYMNGQRLYSQILQRQLHIIGSVVPTLNRALSKEGMQTRKYSEDQLKEIRNALNKKNRIRVVSYNILFDVFDEKLKGEEQLQAWKHRLPRVVASIENMNPDILCVQEAYPQQIEDLKERFKGKFCCFTGEKNTGEINAIFYKQEVFSINEQKSSAFQLPLDLRDEKIVKKIPHFLPPELEPGTWGTLAQLVNKVTGQAFAVINTHLTFSRINSRELQAQFIAEKANSSTTPVIVTMDGNTFPNTPGLSVPFLDGTRVEGVFEKTMKDSEKAALLGHFGAAATGVPKGFNTEDHQALAKAAEAGPKVTMDHIYVSPGTTVLTHATEAARVGEFLPSDHLPVMADLVLVR